MQVPITLLTWPKIVDALLTLISEWGSDCVACLFAYKGWQYFAYINLRPNWFVITLRTWPTIVDAPLTLICRMGHWLCPFVFCLWRLPICWLCVSATELICNCPAYITTVHWRSVDTHVRNGAVTVSLSVLPLKTANTLVCMAATKSIFNYLTYKTKNHWRSINAHFNVLSSQNLLPLIIVWMIM